MKKVLVSGSNGGIRSEVCIHFGKQPYEIHGIDNSQRAVFFGPQVDARGNPIRVSESVCSAQQNMRKPFLWKMPARLSASRDRRELSDNLTHFHIRRDAAVIGGSCSGIRKCIQFSDP